MRLSVLLALGMGVQGGCSAVVPLGDSVREDIVIYEVMEH